MNPPSVLSGAMSRERKPFTYIPGGINLSEIKSERMAQRLMRNAMNEGVAATPASQVQSPPPISTSVVMPNYNCLPVQVFPTFSLPANPKSLLRSRSNPDPNERMLNKMNKPSNLQSKNETLHTDSNIVSKNILPIKNVENNINNCSYNSTHSYDSNGYAVPTLQRNNENILMESNLKENLAQNKFIEDQSNDYNQIRPIFFTQEKKRPENVEIENLEEAKHENINAAVTLKLPSKKSESKTEKKIETLKNILPDGSVQEVKTTTTTTNIDGRIEITTETETTTFPKDCGDDDEYDEVVEEEEEEHEELSEKEALSRNESTNEVVSTITSVSNSKETSELNEKLDSDEVEKHAKDTPNQDNQLITQHESHESSTTKKVVIIQSETQDSDEEEGDEHNEVDVEEVVILKATKNSEKSLDDHIEERTDKKCENYVINNDVTNNKPVDSISNDPEEVDDTEEEYEEVEEEEEAVVDVEDKKGQDSQPELEQKNEVAEEAKEVTEVKVVQEFKDAEEVEELEEVVEEEEVEEVEEEYEGAEESNEIEENKLVASNEISTSTDMKQDEEPLPAPSHEIINDISESDVKTIPIQVVTETKTEVGMKQKENPESQSLPESTNVPLIEPAVPLDKIEEVEIKPIGPAKEIITKTHTEITTTTSEKPVGTHSTQTEFNVLQNIVTVNRTVKTLDHAYEEIPDNIPTIRTFVPPTLEGIFPTSQPAFKPYQDSFTPEPQTERRHSLLLERLSVERQMPPEIHDSNYQSSNQFYEHTHLQEEPQSEILIVSNVKPSTISKNQQWYQKTETDNRSSTLQSTDSLNNNQTQSKFQIPSIYQPKPQSQPAMQTMYQPQIRIQPSPQPIYKPTVTAPVQNPMHSYQPQQSKPTYPSQPVSQRFQQPQNREQSTVQPIYQPQPQYQQSFIDNTSQESYTSSKNKYEHSAYPSYTSTPIWTGKYLDSQPVSSTLPNQNIYQKDITDSFEQSNQKQFSSSYVPPPWEQDSNYGVNNTSNFYQPTPSKSEFTTNTNFKPTKPTPKFSKSTPTSYIPPAPNQSFVKSVDISEPTRQQGRKTYYSEYERRYISVPEATYIPNETKFQPQPDPSPQYFYDNNEAAEVVEPQWRKELREFKEQSSNTTVHTDHTNIRPPWEDDPKYATPKDFAPTPTWTQTLNPRSWRERSVEPEYIGSQEWPKTNTLGRGRPQSSYVKNTLEKVHERTRGVSVDRYNPNNYQSPMTREHPPPSSHILDPIVQGKTYHNPSVPAYHSRASVEPREQPVTYQQPRHRESRAPPVQSRSFKYLQWITGTDD